MNQFVTKLYNSLLISQCKSPMNQFVTALNNSLLISNFPPISCSWWCTYKWRLRWGRCRNDWSQNRHLWAYTDICVSINWHSKQFTDFHFPTNQLFMMMYIQVTLDMRSLSEWLVTKLTFVGLNTRMYHIMSFQFRFPWKTFATIWTREATRFSGDGSKLFQLFLSPRCQWSHAACFDSVPYSKPTWKKHKNTSG